MDNKPDLIKILRICIFYSKRFSEIVSSIKQLSLSRDGIKAKKLEEKKVMRVILRKVKVIQLTASLEI